MEVKADNIKIGDVVLCANVCNTQPPIQLRDFKGKVIGITDTGVFVKNLFKIETYKFGDIIEIKRSGKIIFHRNIGFSKE